MSEHVYKSVEITGSSPEGVTQAIDRAVAKASESVRHLDWFELTSVRGQIADGKVAHYQATLKIGSGENEPPATRERARVRGSVPPTSLSGATTITAPVGDSWARLASWVIPYRPAPSRKWWTGNAGSKLCAMPASVPTNPRRSRRSAPPRQPARALGVRAGRVAAVEDRLLVRGARVPAGAQKQPAALGQCAVLGLEGADVVEGEQVVGVLGGLGGLVDHGRRPDQPGRGQARHVLAVAAGDPVDRRVEVGADVLPDLEHVPRKRAPHVVAADRPPAQARRVGERLREEQHGGVLGERLREVDHAHLSGSERCDEISEHVSPFSVRGRPLELVRADVRLTRA